MHFSHYLSHQAKLANDYVSNKDIQFFPGSVQASSVVRILSSFGNRYKNTYITHITIWINRLYFNISNSKQKQCLSIDTRDVNDLGPGQFRTQADSGT